MATFLVVDDEPATLISAVRAIATAGHRPIVAHTAGVAFALATVDEPAVAVVKIELPDAGGVDVARTLRSKHQCAGIALVSQQHLQSDNAAALQAEGFHLIAKPISWSGLLSHWVHLLGANPPAPHSAGRISDEHSELIGESTAMREVLRWISRVAPTMQTVMICGETGTGKELVARAIHRRSLRATKPFLSVNCAAIPHGLFEAECFGCEAGAFTDARRRRAGWFEQAHGGTVFLDEVGELPLEVQAKLLRVLERREVTRLGGAEAVHVDVRLLTATNVNLERAVDCGSFRRDFYHRIEGIALHLPALRDRGADLQLLIDHYLTTLGKGLIGRSGSISEQALRVLYAYSWPGNIRELRNALNHALLSAAEEPIAVKDLPRSIRLAADLFEPLARTPLARDVQRIAESLERQRICAALENSHGNRSEASRQLGIDRKTMYAKMRRYGISPRAEGGS